MKTQTIEIENETLETLFPVSLRTLSCKREQIIDHEMPFYFAENNAKNGYGNLWFNFDRNGDTVSCVAVYEIDNDRYHWTRENGAWIAGFAFIQTVTAN